MRSTLFALLSVGLFGCAPLPSSAADMEAMPFQPVADKAVVYVVRQPLDSEEAGWLMLDNGEQITTLPGTYYRWEIAPGKRKFINVMPSAEATLDVQPGQIYFLRHTLRGTPRSGPQLAALTPIDPQLGRSLVSRSQRLH